MMPPESLRDSPAISRSRLLDYVREVPDFPSPGILFRDITPLLADPRAFPSALREMGDSWAEEPIDVVAAIEARGFILGAGLALALGAGFVPIRKEGKLPWQTNRAGYTLEYRSDVLQIHQDAVRMGQRVLVVDDVIATGGTAAAAVELVEGLGGEVVGLQFLIELSDLGGKAQLGGRRVESVLVLSGE